MLTLKNNKKGSGAVAKKQLFCNPIFFGFANVLFCVWGVVSLMRPSGAKCGGKKIKAHAVMFALEEFIFVLFILSLKRVEFTFGLYGNVLR